MNLLGQVRDLLRQLLVLNREVGVRLKQREKQSLSRLIADWRRDPMSIDLDMTRLGLLGDFVAACIFIVALCHTMLARIAERSTAGTKSFVCLGPMLFLNDIGG